MICTERYEFYVISKTATIGVVSLSQMYICVDRLDPDSDRWPLYCPRGGGTLTGLAGEYIA